MQALRADKNAIYIKYKQLQKWIYSASVIREDTKRDAKYRKRTLKTRLNNCVRF